MMYLPQILFYAALLLLACSSAARELQSQRGPKNLSVIVNIENIRCCEGVIRLGLYDSKATWLKPDGMVRGRLSIANAEQQRIEIHGLSPGEYAIAVIQDLNQNQKLDRRLGLFPKEPYGFSNSSSRLRRAKFSDAKFLLNSDKELTIHLIDRERKDKDADANHNDTDTDE